MATGMESTPPCACRANDWQDHGGTFAPNFHQRGMLCQACGGISTFIAAGGGNIFVIPNEAYQIPAPAINWVNKVVLPTWRARQEQIEQARKPLEETCWQNACEKLGLPVGTKTDDVPKEKLDEWRKFWDELNARPDYRTLTGFEEPPIPAQMPEGIICYVCKEDGTWRKIEREETLQLVQPPDPIRVRHDEYFNRVFQELAGILGLENIEREEIPNEYCGAESQPWFRFRLGQNTIKLGPRKRVDAIKIESPGFQTEELFKVTVGEYDNSYWADGKWQSGPQVANTIEVHAWNEEQLMRLLAIVGQQCLKAAV